MLGQSEGPAQGLLKKTWESHENSRTPATSLGFTAERGSGGRGGGGGGRRGGGKMSASPLGMNKGKSINNSKKDRDRPKCGCLDVGPCTAPPRPGRPAKLGRENPLRIATVLCTDGDSQKDARQLFNSSGLATVETIHLDPRENLVQQWESLVNSGHCPNLLVTKFSGSRRDDDVRRALTNYSELRNKLSPVIGEIEVTPFQAQITLGDRRGKESVIDHVCGAVNVAFDTAPPPKNSLVKSAAGETEEAASTTSSRADSMAAPGPSASSVPDESTLSQEASMQMRPACLRPASVFIEKGKKRRGSLEEEEEEEEEEKIMEENLGENISRADEGIENEPPDIMNVSKIAVAMFSRLRFPLIVKDASGASSIKAIVFDAGGLAHFRRCLDADITAEEYVNHANTLFKVFVIGDSVFVRESSSLPDLDLDLVPSASDLEELRRKVDGEIVRVEARSVAGTDISSEMEEDEEALQSTDYVTFDSDLRAKKRKNDKIGRLEDDKFAHLDEEVIRGLVKCFRFYTGHHLLEFDIIISPTNGLYHIIDVKVTPKYEGVNEAEVLVGKLLVEEAKRRARERDFRSLKPCDVIELACMFNDDWRNRHVTPRQLKTRHLTLDGDFEVSLVDDATRKEIKCRNAIVKLNSSGTKNGTAKALEDDSIPVEERLMSSYFDGVEADVGFVKAWIPAKPLQVLLTKPQNIPANIWSEIGASISRSHTRSLDALEGQRQKREQEKLKQKPQQRRMRNSNSSSVDQPLELVDAESKSPLEDASAEKAIQEAVFALASSPKRNSVLWKPPFERFFTAARSFPRLKTAILSSLADSVVTEKVASVVASHDAVTKLQVVLGLEEANKTDAETDDRDAGDGAADGEGKLKENTGVEISPEADEVNDDENEQNLVVMDIKILCDAPGSVKFDFAGVDLASVVISLAIMKARNLTNSLAREGETAEKTLERVLREIATGYLDGRGGGGANVNEEAEDDPKRSEQASDGEIMDVAPQPTFEMRVDSVVKDVFKLLPLVALTQAADCILRASAEGQLRTDVNEDIVEIVSGVDINGTTVKKDDGDDDGIIRRTDRKFNWLRHARDHVTVYEDFSERFETEMGGNIDQTQEREELEKKPERGSGGGGIET